MKKLVKSFLLPVCVMFILFYGCNKDNSPGNNTDTETTTSVDNSFAENTSDDVTAVSTQSEDNGVAGSPLDSSSGIHLGHCVNIIRDTVSVPHKLTIDFGTADCFCFDGKYRRGKILVSYTGHYRDSGSTHTISFDGYYVNGNHVEGNQTVTNNGHDSAGFLSFSINISTVITDSLTGKTLTYTSTRTREWVAGYDTWGLHEWSDDIYKITGSASGTNFNGTSFTSTITKPLVVSLSCRWIEAGTIEFMPDGKLTRTVDFGNGDCNNIATVTIAGISFPITLR